MWSFTSNFPWGQTTDIQLGATFERWSIQFSVVLVPNITGFPKFLPKQLENTSIIFECFPITKDLAPLVKGDFRGHIIIESFNNICKLQSNMKVRISFQRPLTYDWTPRMKDCRINFQQWLYLTKKISHDFQRTSYALGRQFSGTFRVNITKVQKHFHFLDSEFCFAI